MRWQVIFVLPLVVLTAFSSTGQAELLNHWTFDDADVLGLVANDTAGSFANNATYRNALSEGMAFGASGQLGQAVNLTGDDGTDRVFDVLNDANGSIEIDGAEALSISMWIRPELTQNGNSTGIFISRDSDINRGTATFGGQFWAVGWEGNNDNDNRVVRADSTGAARSEAVYDGTEIEPEWLHVVMTWEGDGAVDPAGVDDPKALYVNGVLNQAEGFNVNADVYNSGSWLIGGDPDAGSNRNFRGLLDDLAVWDEVLDVTAVTALYNNGLAGINAAGNTSGTPGDFDNDGDVDLDDLDQYNGNIGAAAIGSLAALDFDENGTVDATDFQQHYEQLVETSNGEKGTFAGDLNLDGTVNVLGDAFPLVGNLNNPATSWSQGDLNADGTVNVLGDAFALVGNLGNTNESPAGRPSASAVPEPGAISFLALAGLSATMRRRKQER